MLNSGQQLALDFTKPETVSMSKFQHELLTNYTSLVFLAHALLPFFQKKESTESAIVLYVKTIIIKP